MIQLNEIIMVRVFHGYIKMGNMGCIMMMKSLQNGDVGCPYSDSPSIKNILGTSKSEYQTQPADYKIDMRLNANALTISITHQATVDFNNLEIHVVITEKTHTYDTAPGTNSQVSFSNSVVKAHGQHSCNGVNAK